MLNYLSAILAAVLLFSGSSGETLPFEKTAPFAEATCQVGTGQLQLLLRFDKKFSQGSTVSKTAPLVFVKSKINFEAEPQLNPAQNDFSFLKPSKDSVCDNTEGFAMGEGVIALFYAKENPPFPILYQLLVWDLRSDRLIFKTDLGAVTHLIKTKDGFAFSNQVQLGEPDQFAIKTASGAPMVVKDQDLTQFRNVRLDGARVLFRTDPELTYELSGLKTFFKTKDDFLRSAGWSEGDIKFKNPIVYMGKTNSGESCLWMTNKRGSRPQKPDWHCIQP